MVSTACDPGFDSIGWLCSCTKELSPDAAKYRDSFLLTDEMAALKIIADNIVLSSELYVSRLCDDLKYSHITSHCFQLHCVY